MGVPMVPRPYAYNRRKQYRLHYPIAERPLLDVKGAYYSVTELSEGGMRVAFDENCMIPEDYPFSGQIMYTTGERCSITGKVLRSDSHGFSAQFVKGVGLRRITRDQIRLRMKYPLMFLR